MLNKSSGATLYLGLGPAQRVPSRRITGVFQLT
jgi:hypothetical protein